MVDATYVDVSTKDSLDAWSVISGAKLPLIAAVNGFAFGGGCEIALMCDVVIASDQAQFGQPEIKIGIIPGAGGTQRLTHAIGKSKAMELVLSGGTMSAADAERAGLCSRVVPHDQLMDVTLKLASQIASMSRPVVVLAKEAVNTAYETTLQQGCHLERRLFHSTFALKDRAEGMRAFTEKRSPVWQHV
jgi:enoyl-CoA hydratase